MHTNQVFTDLIIENRHIADLIPYAKNSRLHSKEQVAQIAASIQEFGFTNPILVDEASTIIAGHGRLAAAKSLDLDIVPTIVLRNLTESQRRALVIADNKLAENATWDYGLVKLELESLDNDGFDIGVIGFSIGELANIFDPEGSDGETTGDEEPAEPKPVTCPECACVFVPKKGGGRG
jgi:ParB-like chromosome segregation protein Spo0J